METVNVIDPSTGQAHAIPYNQLPNALQAGGQFADEEQKQKAIKIQDGTYGQSEIPSAGMQYQEPEVKGFKGLAKDTVDMLRHALKGGIAFGADIPNKLKKSGKYIEENPIKSIFHNLGQMGAGAAELAKGGLNLPHEALAELGRKELIPEWLKKYNELPFTHIPEDTGIENALGLQADSEKGDELVRALPAIAGIAAGGRALLKGGKKLYNGPDLKQALRNTQSEVNAAKNSLGGAFDKVANEIDKRGVGAIPIKKTLISQAEKFLDKTPESKDLINRAKTGDYNALRDLQADLREIGESALSNKLSTDRKIGKEALSTRKQINDAVEGHLDESGHKDLADLLKQTKKGYADLQQTYFSSPALARVFGKSQKMPKNPLTLLTEESTEMKRFFNAHPDVEEMLQKALKHGKNKKRAMIGLGVLGTGSTAGITSHLLGK